MMKEGKKQVQGLYLIKAAVLFLLVCRACIMSYSHRASFSHITRQIEPIISVVLYFTNVWYDYDSAPVHTCRVWLMLWLYAVIRDTKLTILFL